MTKIDRRTLLVGLPVATWLCWSHGAHGAHGASGAARARASGSGSAGRDPGPDLRIRSMELRTAASLSEMRRFYGDLLGLPVLEDASERLTIAAGVTRITFLPARGGESEPFYHFAFNIPENKILAARAWQLERTPLEPPGEDLRDPGMPPDVVDYRHWDAHSIFFWDPGGNFVEYIARHTLGNAAPGDFSPRDILYASEIALVSDDTADLAGRLGDRFGLQPYGRGSHAFRAMGDERGLLLVMRRGRRMGWAPGRPIDVAPADVTIAGPVDAELRLQSLPYRIRAS